MNYVDLLAECDDLRTVILHPDGYGHVQVEERFFGNEQEDPGYLLRKIAETNQWDGFYTMVKNKPVSWLSELIQHFPMDKPYSTKCFIKLLTLRSERDFYMFMISHAHEWYWDENSQELKNQLISIINTCLISESPESIEAEILADQLEWFQMRQK
ncbi:hypothetical protein CSW98_07520 [Vibrio sp. HA2012]|nr:hypothetical protein CSW98_07520 [Vibrio sp. HA2012]